jgi:lipoprotein-anchoring transpeptidase ErfK/SrfK
VTELANLPGDVPSYAEPGGEVIGTVDGSWWGYQSILPILVKKDGFLLVRLQQRPNESTAWIAAADVTITTTAYRIGIDTQNYKVTLFKDGAAQVTFNAGVGGAATPTPVGSYFVTMLSPGPSSGYGPQVLALSAHSETIDDWQGSGDAVTAIHGPVGADGQISGGGGAFTNGCVRLHLEDLEQLYQVPPGSPVDIT